MESLWRLRQWEPVPGPDGFHSSFHRCLSSISQTHAAQVKTGRDSGNSSGSSSGATASDNSVECHLQGLLSHVKADLVAASPTRLSQGIVRLQMIGSVVDLRQALCLNSSVIQDSRSCNVGVKQLVTRWQHACRGTEATQSFKIMESVHAVRASLLGIAAPASEQLRFLTRFAALARKAGEPNRALELLEQADLCAIKGKEGILRTEYLRARWQQAHCFWVLQQQQQALSIANRIATECQKIVMKPGGALADADTRWASRVLSDTGLWLSEAKMEKPETILQKFLNPAVQLSPQYSRPRRQLADFLDGCLSEELSRQTSVEQKNSVGLARSGQEGA